MRGPSGSLRNWGEERRYYPVLKGYNYRLSGIQAAILRVKLKRLEQWIEIRRNLATEYDRLLEDASVKRPEALADVRHVYCLYTIQASGRDELQQELEGAGIKTAVHYPTPIHLMPAYADQRYKAGSFPIAEACARSVLSLPLYPQMNSGQVREVANEVQRLSRKTGQQTLLQGR